MNKKENKKNFLDLTIDEQVVCLEEALSEDVYPILERDGGGMEIMDVQKFEIFIRYHGACSHCPIAESGTLIMIQDVLQEKIDPRIQVRIV